MELLEFGWRIGKVNRGLHTDHPSGVVALQ
jgi:hypothetical protein